MFLKRKFFQRTFDQMIIKFTKRNSTGINSQTNSKTEGILPLRYEGILLSYKKFSHCGQGVRIVMSIQDRKEYSTDARTIQSVPDITQQKEFQM